ncbi:Crp/Fnr family transcriptional regulator [Corynebacterium lubricantis]|uniref:Crp/Fnr family transcriptional regulator n=1 Tax=Corynebacterium lubricantis TaxID=541095 RepID=UPI000476656A|nr:Crp/Fnr family transcriptional regulator [Corynebacterium lubricantis]
MARNPVRSSCAQPHECGLDVRLNALARNPLTKHLTHDDHLLLDTYVSAWAWGADEPIVFAGEESEGSYLIVHGRVRMSRDTADGRNITIDIAAPGDIVGPISSHVATAESSAWAMETTCALYLEHTALAEVLERWPSVGVALLQLQQARLTEANDREVAHVSRTVEQRVAAVLLRLDEKMGQHMSDGSHLIQVKVRREDIAGMAGTTVESASRAMSGLKKKEIIDSGREWVRILNVDLLEDIAHSLDG